MSIVALSSEDNTLADPQPADGDRDRYGHFKGCMATGCESTRCRDFGRVNLEIGWHWAFTVPRSERHRITHLL